MCIAMNIACLRATNQYLVNVALFYHELVTNQINLSYLPVSFLLSPVGITVGSSSGNMYVTDSENNNIQKFAAR
jgi:NHL repeat